MDNLTHALVGAAISKAGAERATPLATATLVVAANAPDIDMLSYAGGEYFALAFRRGITHGILALVVLPFVVAGVMLAWDRGVRRRRDPGADPARVGPTLVLSALGLATHPTLDWMNTYGVRWGLPFDGSWSYGDALFIIDPWIWLALGGSVFLASAPRRAGLVGWGVLALLASALVWVALHPVAGVVWTLGLAAVLAVRLRQGRWVPRDWRDAGAPRERRSQPERRAASRLAPPDDRVFLVRPDRRLRLVRLASAAVGVYILAMVAADLAARRDVARAAAAEGIAVRDLMVAPARGNPFVTRIEVLTDDAFMPGVHRWLDSPRVELFPDAAVPLVSAPPDAPRALTTRVLNAARRMPRVRNYLTWARYPYVRVDREPGGWQVRFSDARYDDEPGAGGLSGVSVHIAEVDTP